MKSLEIQATIYSCPFCYSIIGFIACKRSTMSSGAIERKLNNRRIARSSDGGRSFFLFHFVYSIYDRLELTIKRKRERERKSLTQRHDEASNKKIRHRQRKDQVVGYRLKISFHHDRCYHKNVACKQRGRKKKR